MNANRARFLHLLDVADIDTDEYDSILELREYAVDRFDQEYAGDVNALSDDEYSDAVADMIDWSQLA